MLRLADVIEALNFDGAADGELLVRRGGAVGSLTHRYANP